MQQVLNKNNLKTVIMSIIAFVAIFQYSPSTTYACSCAESGPPLEELARSAAVFSGTVIEIEDTSKNKLFQSSADPVTVNFEIEESWKGPNQPQMTIQTERSSASCGYEFARDKEYLIYAYEDNGTYKVSLCSRTTPLAVADKDIQELGIGKKPIEQPSNDVNDSDEEKQPQNLIRLSVIVLVAGLLLFIVYRLKQVRK